MKNLLPKGEFFHHVLTLMTGTVAAQAIPIIASPVLTRIYSPEDFGLFALFTSVISILTVVSTGRYELAVMHPCNDDDAKAIVVLSLFINSMVGLAFAFLVVIFNEEISNQFKNPKLGEWLCFVPLIILISGYYQVFNYWLNRQKCYKRLSQNKMIQASGITVVQLCEGFAKAGVDGLLIGHLSGWLISLFSISRSFNFHKELFGIKKIRHLAARYKNYPLMQAPSSLLDTASNQAPIFFLTEAYMSSTVGFYNLTVKVLAAPLAIISKAIGQVYFQRISEIAQTAPHRLVSEILTTTKKLIFIAIIIFSPFVLYGKEIFNFIFGSTWQEAGLYAQLLSPVMAIKFIVSPISTIFLATEKIKLGSIWQVFYFITSFIMFFIAIRYDVKTLLLIYMIHEVCLYLLYFALMVLASKKFAKEKLV